MTDDKLRGIETLKVAENCNTRAGAYNLLIFCQKS